ncbi:Asp-tRNAAsn/Glu-tRNAGln amidotransferase A subunit [Enhydrobacter aerosaccus]|uniref:Asp-tRNAAsn/Glu-tRNAGln amidotransferase A subunit n=1 Tax=Enhydrobacter aerosaccus TaxID=225324 RepID=A0A1T4RB57_9HYPH|nr:amidase [Enhydrobacter aerosaccus]SKA12938.1 Asp-tRNAAsn/Glu-tRNAGln amidotransferase A subunit [Enhydrobacter aerosaccus]
MATAPNKLTASAAVQRMAQKRLKARDLVEACLDRIEAREGQVHAWEALDPDGARRRADQLDKRARPVGPLHGIPLAVKDIIATRTLPTTCGSPIYRDHVVGKDAACVTQLVQAGAIVLGKSVTTEFAGAHAGKTHNPHNLRHTPAGSSSGSAAAVADFMAPVGYGTQTAGSVIRPGAFNGVVAYKGTYGWADMAGVKPYAKSLDTLGFFVREANDLALIRAAYGHAPADPPTRAPRIGLCRTLWWDQADASNRKNIEAAARALRAAGAKVRTWNMPENWDGLLTAQNRLMSKEATQSYAAERKRFPHLLSASLLGVLETGDSVSRAQLADVKKRKQRAHADLAQAWEDFDFLLAPAAKGEAPAGLGNTGDPLFNRFWTLLGTPCIALPFNTGPFGLPLSLQLVGPLRDDDQLVAWARWVEQHLS